MSEALAQRPEPTLDNRQLLAALRAFRRGDFSVRLPGDLTGMDGDLAEAFNDVVELSDQMSREFSRLGEVVGRQGKINHRAKVPAASGSWAASVDAVNTLIADMVHPTAEMARVIGAVAKGDLSQTMDLENEE
jgi:methyl-accepting chemotaxis protein